MKKLIIFLFIISLPLFAQNKGIRGHNGDIKCSYCHTCENPTKLDNCLVECPRHEIITVHTAPEDSPEIIVIDGMKEFRDLYKPVNFSHKVHAEMSLMGGGCVMCHHYNPPGKVQHCDECHEADRSDKNLKVPDLLGAFHQQCIDCHRDWGGKVDCNFCHIPNDSDEKTEEAAKLKKSAHGQIKMQAKYLYETDFDDGVYVTFYHMQHTELYGAECVDCHKNETCSSCHIDKGIMKIAEASESDEEKHDICSACHDTDDDCEFCHKEKETPPFDHKRNTGFDLAGYHSKLACSDCHKGSRKKGLRGNCVSCHRNWNMETFDHKVTGLELSEIHLEMECGDCHKNNDYRKKPDCSDCHDDISYPDSLPGKKN